MATRVPTKPAPISIASFRRVARETGQSFDYWLRPVESSFIDEVGFAKIDGLRLVLVRIRGDLYAYKAPMWTLGLMLAANAQGRSVGRVFSRHVRRRFLRVVLDAA